MLFSKKTEESQMEKLLKKFVYKLEDKDELDEDLKSSIMELATAENKEEIMQDLLKKVEVHKDYDEESGVQFPWQGYTSAFLDEE